MNVPKLQPQTKPGSKHYWVRFDHPATHQSERVELGNDLAEASIICTDLATILGNPNAWNDRHHPDNDGLHPIALGAFYDHLESLLHRLRLENVRLQLQSIGMQLEKMEILDDTRWIFNSDREKAVSRGWCDKNAGFAKKFTDEQLNPVDSLGESIHRWGLPDGDVVYAKGSEAGKELQTQIERLFSWKECIRDVIWESKPKSKYLPEIRTIFGIENGFAGIPRTVTKPLKRYRCIYRFETHDGEVAYADGCVAFERHHEALHQQHKLTKCRISVELKDKLSKGTLGELQRLHPAPGNSFEIPMPPQPPKRTRRKLRCPKCQSENVRVGRYVKNNRYERECTDCKERFEA